MSAERGPVKLTFTRHALHKMAEKGIQPDWVTKTVDAPEYVQPDPNQPGALRRFGRIPEFGDHWLRVVTIDRMAERIVITATWHRNAGKRR